MNQSARESAWAAATSQARLMLAETLLESIEQMESDETVLLRHQQNLPVLTGRDMIKILKEALQETINGEQEWIVT